jgi:hypothetical protein
MTASRIRHVLQPAPLVRELDEAMDYLHGLFGIYPSERIRIPGAGVDNAVYPLGAETFLELIAPYEASSSAGKLLERRGPGWHMCSFDIDPAGTSEVDGVLKDRGVRVVEHNSFDAVEAWHLHPKDVGGALTLLAARRSLDDNALYAGRAYRAYVRTNTRVVGPVAGISWIGEDVDSLSTHLARVLGIEFGDDVDDGDSVMRESALSGGTFIQARAPSGASGNAAGFLERCGPGLYHLALRVADKGELERRLNVHGLTPSAVGTSGWLDSAGPLRFPIEFLSG